MSDFTVSLRVCENMERRAECFDRRVAQAAAMIAEDVCGGPFFFGWNPVIPSEKTKARYMRLRVLAQRAHIAWSQAVRSLSLTGSV